LKVLIVSYYWPPSGGSGVQRWMYFTKYLQSFGIEPIIVTIDPKSASYNTFDESLLKEVSSVRTIHTQGGFQILKLYSFLKSGSANKKIPTGNLGSKAPSFFDKIASKVRANYFIPDARVSWNKKALPEIQKTIKEEGIDLFITTGPPHSTHLLGLAVRKSFPSIKWIADFRDPWREVYYNNLFKRSKKSDEKDALFEKEVIEKSDIILTVGPSMAELLSSKTSNPSKVKYILNGFEASKIDGLTRQKHPDFTITHVGVWTLQQPFQEVADALQQVLKDHSDWKINFRLVGNIHEDIFQALQEVKGLTVELVGKVDHQTALQEMMNADVLLNCLANMEQSKLLISGKLMEYLATGNNTIIIGNPEGDAAHLAKPIPNAEVVSPNDINSLKIIFEKFYSAGRANHQPHPSIYNYTRENTAKELKELIENL
jgi:glycosyltransferase involved in cell wall biosynthesis